MIDRHFHHAAADTRTAAQTAERRVSIISATAQQRRHRSNGNNLFHIHSHPLPQGRLKRPAKSLNKRVLYRKQCEMGDWGKSGIIRFFGKIEDLSMANSNENTQNPKDNQNKMTDEGIQEHSEHTAENKQHESKDNAQKKNESTCLCKFFKKITEWMCASENKNSNKADENAAENNDAAKQAEMKQADTFEQPKEQIKLSDYLEIISKLLGIFSVYGIFIGGITIYSYLLNIGQLSIFPDVIASAANLLTISISFGIIFLIIYALLYFIFCLANPEGIKNDIPSYKLEGWSIIIVLFAIIYLILIFLNIISFSFSDFVVFFG